MTGYTSTPEKLAAIRARVALGKRIQPAQGRVLLEEIARLRTGRFVPTHHRELRALAQRVVDAQYPGEHVGEDVATAISTLSGWLADHPEAL